MSKKPLVKSNPSFSKDPRVDQARKSYLYENPSWQLRSLDSEGSWGWKVVSKDLVTQDIIPKLQSFESMHWNDILGRNSHEISVDRICKEAKKRLQELKHVDIENLVSLRLTGKNRIWGIRNGSILRILWWDPDHTVYPVELKHT